MKDIKSIIENEFPILETDRLLLRALRANDNEFLFKLRSNPDIMRFIERLLVKNVAQVDSLISSIIETQQRGEAIFWIILAKNGLDPIGNISLWNVQNWNNRGELGYMMNETEQGKGIMSEALRVVIDYCFNDLSMHSLEAHTRPKNIPSIRVLEKLGFERSGLFKENVFFNSEYWDTMVFSLINENDI